MKKTLRDEFAIAALPFALKEISGLITAKAIEPEQFESKVAALIYLIADAIIEAREASA